LVSVGLYNVRSVEEGVIWQRWQVILLGLSGIATLHFVADYTQRVPRRMLLGLTVFYAITSLFQLIDRSALTWPGRSLHQARAAAR
jgi:hypothetical protein